MTLDARKRWIALYILCLGDLMIVLDSTIVNVALPSIRDDLGFSEASLAWVVNAYLLTFGGFLLLAGRFGDLYGQKRLFLIGIAGFTVASLGCGLANSQEFLVIARAVQGIGGAIVAAIALSLLMILFTEPAERAKAMGTIGFVLSGGGTAGVLLGGVLTDILSWHWIFLVNIPVGITVFVLCRSLLPADHPTSGGRLDLAGAVTVTASLMLAVYAIVNGNAEGWTSGQTLGMLGAALVLFVAFLVIESRVDLRSCRWGSSSSATSRPRTRRASCSPVRCSPGSSSRRSTCSACWTTARSRSGSHSCPARSSGVSRRCCCPTGS